MTVNKVILIGNLGRDPELRNTESGTAVANLSVATSERRKDRDGNWNDHTEWHRATVFGRTAENAARYLQKGRQVYVEGKLRTTKWQAKDGSDRWTTEVVVDQLRFLGGRDGNASQGTQERRGGSGGYGSARQGGYGGGGYGGDAGAGDDSIPFMW